VNAGIFEGLEPTGRTYVVQHMHFFKVVGGEITEHWANRDDLGAASQIGLELKTGSRTKECYRSFALSIRSSAITRTK
jgi:hypothetical protein